MHYYNEKDPFAAQWLRNLIHAKHLPQGEVDERSIVDVRGSDLRGFIQCHFFAGIGGWPLAARIAGWPETRRLWTGSPPCQPFSSAGKGLGTADDRHLWPYLCALIESERPPAFFGEQVAAAAGRHWLDGVLANLERIDYAGRAVVLPACAVNAAHRRDRLWIVAHAIGERLQGAAAREEPRGQHESGGRDPGAVADPYLSRFRASRRPGLHSERQSRALLALDHALALAYAGSGSFRNSGCSESSGKEEALSREVREQWLWPDTGPDGSGGSAYGEAGWIVGHDEKARRFESSIPLLVNGVSGRVAVLRPDGQTHWYNRAGALKGFGNAIVPQVAAEVIAAYLDCFPNE